MPEITNNAVLSLLEEDAEKIKNLIKQQSNTLCIAQCKAFEEVVDTQMFGLSREILFAERLGVITAQEGQALLSDLEKELNQIYSNVYDLMGQGGFSHGKH